MSRRIAVRGIIVHKDKLFCVRLTPYRSTNVDFWCVPGGGIEDGESILRALEREIFEETGVTPVVGHLMYVQQFMQNGSEQFELFFHIGNAEDFLNIDLSKTTHGMIEINKAEFINPSENNVLPKFLTNTKIDPKDKEVKFFSYL